MNQDKVVLVTGAARRLGKVITETFHQAGFKVVIHCRSSLEEGKSLAAALNAQRENSAVVVQANLNIDDDVKRLAVESISNWGRLDCLVNSASMFYPTPVDSATSEDWDVLFDSNLKAPYFLIQACVAALRDSGGSIINIADIYADRPLNEHSLYCMAKAANVMMTKSLAVELGPEIRVNGIAPGAILWPENGMDQAEKENILNTVPLARKGTAEDIASAILDLQSSRYITGQIIAVDGGRSLSW
ncbi:pteridine reductase [Veronia nyctiphanis]|uniref:Pteridine reductase n=1 Tax=Veronia nyctiphanis TaxID=1278244 RepID=A0A4V1LSX5_9GAMM|nr:pteridine reductase [Veronia nyctiphanis]RXJ73218.1 pteridine reductase [Veronia nyctiphanis]